MHLRQYNWHILRLLAHRHLYHFQPSLCFRKFGRICHSVEPTLSSCGLQGSTGHLRLQPTFPCNCDTHPSSPSLRSAQWLAHIRWHPMLGTTHARIPDNCRHSLNYRSWVLPLRRFHRILVLNRGYRCYLCHSRTNCIHPCQLANRSMRCRSVCLRRQSRIYCKFKRNIHIFIK